MGKLTYNLQRATVTWKANYYKIKSPNLAGQILTFWIWLDLAVIVWQQRLFIFTKCMAVILPKMLSFLLDSSSGNVGFGPNAIQCAQRWMSSSPHRTLRTRYDVISWWRRWARGTAVSWSGECERRSRHGLRRGDMSLSFGSPAAYA